MKDFPNLNLNLNPTKHHRQREQDKRRCLKNKSLLRRIHNQQVKLKAFPQIQKAKVNLKT
ncbi:hypothetical protein S83_009058, partial [Arachis hypogaea]